MSKFFKHIADDKIVYFGPVLKFSSEEWQSVFDRIMSKTLISVKSLVPEGGSLSIENMIEQVKSSNKVCKLEILRTLKALLVLDSDAEMVMVGDVNLFLPINCDPVTLNSTLNDPVSGLVSGQDNLLLIDDLKVDMCRYMRAS